MKKNYCKNCKQRQTCKKPCDIVEAELRRVEQGRYKEKIDETPISWLPAEQQMLINHELYCSVPDRIDYKITKKTIVKLLEE